MNRQSTSASWAIRLTIAPARKVDSRTSVNSAWSATWARGESFTEVTATVVAPFAAAASRNRTVSMVDPACENPIATVVPTGRTAAAIASWGSERTWALRPTRSSLCARSSATNWLAPMP